MYDHEAGGVAVSACADILRHDSGESLNTRPWPKILDHYRRPGGHQQRGKKLRDLGGVVLHDLSSVWLCSLARRVMGVGEHVLDELRAEHSSHWSRRRLIAYTNGGVKGSSVVGHCLLCPCFIARDSVGLRAWHGDFHRQE